MAAVDPRTPCLIGVAQQTWHLTGTEQAPEPLAMHEAMVRAAATDTGARVDRVLGLVDSLQVVYCMTWPYDDLPARLAQRLDIAPRHHGYSGMSGTVPQELVSAAATSILAGDLDLAVVTGAEALDTKRRLKKAGERPAWSHRHPDGASFPFEFPFHRSEVAHNVFQAWLTFAVRDIARRAHLGAAPDEHRRAIGELLAPMTEVAAANPHAWFPEAHTAAELVDVTPDNRLVGYPYTKRTVAIMDVDMAAAVIVASHEAADHLGVPADRRVYLRGWGRADDARYVAEHPDLWRSPAMATSFGQALGAAGAGIDDVAHLDLYSCFASSVQFACDALGIDPLAPGRPLTVTGGLPYAGGPAGNYMGHSLAAMVGVLRDDPGSLGLVSGVGMHMTKHTAAVYSTTPGPVAPPATAPPAEAVPIVAAHAGPATVAAYTVVHGRDGAAASGLLVLDVPGAKEGGGRAYALVDDADTLAALEAEECVGRTVQVATDPPADDSGSAPVNRATL